MNPQWNKRLSLAWGATWRLALVAFAATLILVAAGVVRLPRTAEPVIKTMPVESAAWFGTHMHDQVTGDTVFILNAMDRIELARGKGEFPPEKYTTELIPGNPQNCSSVRSCVWENVQDYPGLTFIMSEGTVIILYKADRFTVTYNYN